MYKIEYKPKSKTNSCIKLYKNSNKKQIEISSGLFGAQY